MSLKNQLKYQNFNKIKSFLKPALNIVLRTVIAGWGRGLLNRWLVFCIKYIDLGEVLKVGESTINQSKSWYYLGTFQIFKGTLSGLRQVLATGSP